MNIAIYQINPDRDENNVAFLNYENLERFQGSAALRSEQSTSPSNTLS